MDLSSYAFSALRDGELSLYRGSGVGLDPILLVTSTASPSSRESIERLEHEYALRDTLDAVWAARPTSLVRRDGRMVLVLEDPGGDPLDRLLGGPLDVAAFLNIAIPLAETLGHVHASGLIHKDVKPAHILVNVATGGVWLTGFGIASRLSCEHQSQAPPEVIAGTLAYIAPEQTGRMNRSVDSRSDLYALGVTFFEMLTGSRPFTASDPMGWVHCHIARQPASPDERVPSIPGPLSAIVLKLLAKTAEDRYQTTAGLAVDLRRCLADWESFGHIEAFPLGGHDASDRLLIPEKLYGREREIELLLSAFDRVVATRTPELVLVSGYSGVGKSSMVHELHKRLVPTGGLFASGKFDQYKRDIPYATVAQAIQSLVRRLLGRSEAELERWRDALRDALGQNGQLIVNLIPEIELVMGKQPPVPGLSPQDARNHFHLVFRRLIGVFARPEHPFVLFLDDLQWLDSATLDLLEHLTTHSEGQHLLLVGAYRDNEISPSHPLVRTLEAIRAAGARVQEIVLAPLGLDDVGRLVADALHCTPKHAEPLAQLIHGKTGGNPFFAIQFFTALAEDRLLVFDRVTAAWQWDMDRVRAKSYTDNVVELMAEKLMRFSRVTQQAVSQLACLGNVADVATLALVHGGTEHAAHAALREAVEAGLVVRLDSAYTFLHDRIQQAAYSLIPEQDRAGVRLRIGRMLLASMSGEQLTEHLFEVANQFNRGAVLLADPNEKADVATIHLRAGRKAKASTAYASACAYLAAGMALLDERDWSSRYELTFGLWLERAECEFLSGNFDKAEQLIGELVGRAGSNVDKAAVYQVKVLLHTVKAENVQAVESGLECLHLFGIDLPAHPTAGQVQAEYGTVWESLDGRSIESLIDLPMMTDPELRTAMQVLSVLTPAAYDTDLRLFCLLVCRMVNVSVQHGMSGASAHGYAHLGSILGPVFHRYRDACRFARLACDLVEKHGFIAYRAKAYNSMGLAAQWTQSITTAIDFLRAMFRAATETGDLTYACYASYLCFTNLVARNDPLDTLWRESETALDFVREAGFSDIADIIRSQQRFIATMQGRTATLSTFSDAHFDEATFEAQLTPDRLAQLVCYYWIVKLKARFLSGDYAEALAAADKAKPLLAVAVAQIQLLDYFYFAALTVAALYEKASPTEQTRSRDLLTIHAEQLREWAETYPPTFADKHALVSAEIARIDGRDGDAARLYEQAIRAARDHGFVQHEALAYEVAARFYAARGLETIEHAYLCDARNRYVRWGAAGKVRQLERRHPHLREHPIQTTSPTTTIGAPVSQLDVETVIKASQVLSSEIVLPRLIETLMRIAVEHAGADRGLLILLRGNTLQIEAEASTDRRTVALTLRQDTVTPYELPESLLHTVIRTRQNVLLDDASAENPFSADAYFQQPPARSVLCVPMMKQATLIGMLYLENTLASHVFTRERIAVLEWLASQAAISLENARLYAQLANENHERQTAEDALRVSEERWRNLVEGAPVGVALTDTHGHYVATNSAFQRMMGYSESELRGRAAADITHEDDRVMTLAMIVATAEGKPPTGVEKRYRHKDGSVVWAEVSGFPIPVAGRTPLLAGIVVDITDRKRAEDALRQAQADLARVSRVTTMGELTASLSHEVKQPITAAVTDANTCVRWLAHDPPDLDEARAAALRVVQDGRRATEIISRIRLPFTKGRTERESVDVNELIREMTVLLGGEAARYGVAVRAALAADLSPVMADRVQLQQVLMNLILNGIEAMKALEGERNLTISSQRGNGEEVVVSVSDTGVGLPPQQAEQIFKAFFTTKKDGLGMGLSISRSIVEAHGGRLWAADHEPRGATFCLALPAQGEALTPDAATASLECPPMP
ncbi:MAG: multi-sensor signal transduction multi-kinase [Acidobacteria bacterium]|nr:multi-sensor signal transduction multi-kinase [Acidobacteriota bacterium]